MSRRIAGAPGPRPGAGNEDESFAEILHDLAAPYLASPRSPIAPAEPLVPLEYALELRIKTEALRRFWIRRKLEGSPEPVLASPRPRQYRTTSKRRVVLRGADLALIVGDRGRGAPQRGVQDSRLEPDEHRALYDFLYGKLVEPAFRPLARHLNYLIVRGSYAERAVVFNVDRLDANVVRKLKQLADHLRKTDSPPVGAFVFLDPSRSDYYLESRRPAEGLSDKKLYGADSLTLRVGSNRFRFSPLSFSQVNESAVPVLLDLARQLLPSGGGRFLVDLYCGYGLFSHFLAPDYEDVLGVDAEGPSIEAAAANTRSNPAGGRRRFVARRITAAAVDELLRRAASPDALLLDPPRQGPLPGVIAALAAHRPRSVVHVFCGVDQIPAGLREWRRDGYRVDRVVAVDLFPGTANLEVLVRLCPAQSVHSTPMRGSGR